MEVRPLAIDDRITNVDLINPALFTGPILTVTGSLVAGTGTSAAGINAVSVPLVLSMIKPQVRSDPMRIRRSFRKGAQSGATLLIPIAAIGILAGSLDSTGLGLKLADVISTVRGESLFSALLVAMVGALVPGAGMPTLPACLIIILVTGPAIQAPGVSMLTAHMFVFYHGVASSLTPPVAIAADAAAPIAGANPLVTALVSFRLGMAKFVIPFIFAFCTTILVIEEFSPLPFLWIVARTCLFIWLFSSAVSGFDRRRLAVAEIIAMFAAAFATLAINPAVRVSAILVGQALVACDIRAGRTAPTKTAASS